MTSGLESDVALTRFSIQLNQEGLSETVRSYTAELETIHTELKLNISKAQQHYQGPADAQHLAPPELKVGDLVFVLAKFIRTTWLSKKLSEKYLGPFEITGKLSNQSYQIKLPAHLHSIHPMFHISQLEPATASSIPQHTNELLPPIEVDGQMEFELSRILDSKFHRQRREPLLYYVQWAGYEGTAEEFSWLEASELEHATELVKEFHSLNSCRKHCYVALFVVIEIEYLAVYA